jgi:peroxiredoxin
MARTNSTMMPLGTLAPDFALPDTVSGKTVSRADFAKAPALLVMFLCNHCPYVKHVQAGLAALAKDLQARGVGVVAISSNDVANYPDDSPEKMKEEAQRAGYTFPYLYDESQSVARAYRAACTPDFFLFDGAGKLVYRGQMDEARRANDLPVTGKSLRDAVDAVLSGKAVSPTQIPSLGCNIKWKPGNEPEYFKLL